MIEQAEARVEKAGNRLRPPEFLPRSPRELEVLAFPRIRLTDTLLRHVGLSGLRSITRKTFPTYTLDPSIT
jgi:hypothetical protein